MVGRLSLASITLDGPACAGNMCNTEWPIGFLGRIAFVEVYDSPISAGDSACLFSHTPVQTCGAAAAALPVVDSLLLQNLTESPGVAVFGDVRTTTQGLGASQPGRCRRYDRRHDAPDC